VTKIRWTDEPRPVQDAWHDNRPLVLAKMNHGLHDAHLQTCLYLSLLVQFGCGRRSGRNLVSDRCERLLTGDLFER